MNHSVELIAKESSSEQHFDSKRSNGRWTREEHTLFVEAIKKFGKNWKKVEDYIGTRTGAQIRSHAQKFFLRLEKDLKGNDIPFVDKNG